MTVAELRRLAEATRAGREPPVEAIETAAEHVDGEPAVSRAAHEVLVAATRADPSATSRAVAALLRGHEWNDGSVAASPTMCACRELAATRPPGFQGSVEPLVRAGSDGMGDMDRPVTGLCIALARRVPGLLRPAVAWHATHAEEGIYTGDRSYRLIGLAGAAAPATVRSALAPALQTLAPAERAPADPEALVRAVDTLESIGLVLPDAVPRVGWVLDLLGHDDPDVRKRAARTLGHISSEDRSDESAFPGAPTDTDRVVSGLVAAWDDTEAEVRREAHAALGLIGFAEPRLAAACWVPVRRALADSSRPDGERAAAATALGRLAAVRDASARQELLELLADAVLEAPRLWRQVRHALVCWRVRVADWSLADLPDTLTGRLLRRLLGLPHWGVTDEDSRDAVADCCATFPPSAFDTFDVAALARRQRAFLQRRLANGADWGGTIPVLGVLGRVDETAADVAVRCVIEHLRDEGEGPISPGPAITALERIASDPPSPAARDRAVAVLTAVLVRTGDAGTRDLAASALETVVDRTPEATPTIAERFLDRHRGPTVGDAPGTFRAVARVAPGALEPGLLDLLAVAAGAWAPDPALGPRLAGTTGSGTPADSDSPEGLADLFGDDEDEGEDESEDEDEQERVGVETRRAAARAVLYGVAADPDTAVVSAAELKPLLWQDDHDDAVVAAVAGALAVRADRFDTRRYAVERLRTLLARRRPDCDPSDPPAGVRAASHALAVVAAHAPDAVAPAVGTLAACEAPVAQRALARVAITDARYLPAAVDRLGTGRQLAGEAGLPYRDPLATQWLLRAYPTLGPALVPTLATRCGRPSPPENWFQDPRSEPSGSAEEPPTYRERTEGFRTGERPRERLGGSGSTDRAFERTVVDTLADVPGEAAADYLEGARSDPDPYVRQTAREALEERPIADAGTASDSGSTSDSETAPDVDLDGAPDQESGDGVPSDEAVLRAIARVVADPDDIGDRDRDRLRGVGTTPGTVAGWQEDGAERADGRRHADVGADDGRSPDDRSGTVPVDGSGAGPADGSDAVVLLGRAATAEQPAVRAAAATALGAVGHRAPGRAAEVLAALLADPDPVVAEAAARAAGRVARTAPAKVALLPSALRGCLDGPAATVEAVVSALGWAGVATGADTVEPLVDRLWAPEPTVRRRAATAIARVARHDDAVAAAAAPALERRFLEDPAARGTLAVALASVPVTAVESPRRLGAGLVRYLAGNQADDVAEHEEGVDAKAGAHAAGIVLTELARAHPDAVREALGVLPDEVAWSDLVADHPIRRVLPAVAIVAATDPGLEVPGRESLHTLLAESALVDAWTGAGARALARTGASLHVDRLDATATVTGEAGTPPATDAARFLVHAARAPREEGAEAVVDSDLDTRAVARAVRDVYERGKYRPGAVAALRELVQADAAAVAPVAAGPIRRELDAPEWGRRLDATAAVPPLVRVGELAADRAVGLLFPRLDDEVVRVRRAAGTAIAAIARRTDAGVTCLVRLLDRRLSAGRHDRAPQGELRALAVLGRDHRFVHEDCRRVLTRARERFDEPVTVFAEEALETLDARPGGEPA